MGAQVWNRVTAANIRLVQIVFRASKVSLGTILGSYNNMLGLTLVLDRYVNKSSIRNVKVKLDTSLSTNTTRY